MAETHADGVLSPYLIFSLFNDARLRLTLSPEIDAWRQQVLAPPPAPPALPEILRPYQRRGVEWRVDQQLAACGQVDADLDQQFGVAGEAFVERRGRSHLPDSTLPGP